MTIRPCNEFIDCECSDNPFINTSAERPDPNLFFARRYFPNNPSLNENDTWYERLSCLGTCFSQVSQLDAEDCALRNAQLCTWTPVQPPLTLLSDDPTSIPRSNIFGNAAVSCTSPCADGSVSSFTVPPNTFYGLTQQEADALAQSVCDYRALVNRMCSNVPPEPPVCDVTITSVMPPSGYQYANEGESVAFGVTFDFTGMTNPTFLWLKDGFPLTQTENPSLAISPVIAGDTGIYQLVIIVPNCPPVLSPIFELIVCVPSTGVPAPDFVPGQAYYSYTTPVSLGTFQVIETGNTHDPGFGENVDNLGGRPAGWYEAIYRGGGREQTTPLSPPTTFHADAWAVRMEIGSSPDTDVLTVPFDFSNYGSCVDAENSIGGADIRSSGIVETTNDAGGEIKTVGPAWPVNGGFSLASCNGSRPEVEIIHYNLAAQPDNLRVVDFDNFKSRLNICTACADRLIGSEWDGSFIKDIYTPFNLVYRASPDTAAGMFKFKNKRTNQQRIRITLGYRADFTPIWQLAIVCEVSAFVARIVWIGYKSTGETAEGVYLIDPENPACVDQQVKCCTLEAF